MEVGLFASLGDYCFICLNSDYLFFNINFQNVNQINVNIEELFLVLWFAQ